MRAIQLHKQATKFISSLPAKQKRQIAIALLSLQSNDLPHDAKKLKGYEYHRVDCGEYRVIYEWDETLVFVYIIGKRNNSDVYRKLDRGN